MSAAEIDHLSYSSISGYLSCAAWWNYKYNQKQKTWSTPELAFGTAFHKTVERFMVEKGSLTQTWLEEAPHAFADENIAWGATSIEEMVNDGVRMLGNSAVQDNLAKIAPKTDEKGAWIERRVELRAPGVPVPVIGYIDVVAQDGTPGDFKTASKSWTLDRARGETQSLFYLAALNQAGITDHNWTFRHYVLTKLKKEPRLDVFEHKHQPGEVMWLLGMISKVWKGIAAGVYPENPTGWKCSPEYCDFWQQCRGKWA